MTTSLLKYFYFISFYLYIYLPDSQESVGGAIHRATAGAPKRGVGVFLEFLTPSTYPPPFFKKKRYRCADTKPVDQVFPYKHRNSLKISDRVKVNAVILVMVCTLNFGQK